MDRVDLSKVYDLRHLDFDIGISGSSAGILPKVIVNSSNKRLFIKLSSFSLPYGFYGTEAILELINSRIGEILRLPVLRYGLKAIRVSLKGREYITLASFGADYTSGDKAISFEKFYEIYSIKGETTLAFIKRLGICESIYKEFVFDYIICNLDRHGKNTEIMTSKTGTIRVAPFFDNSLTFVGLRPQNEIESKAKFNDSIAVNNYIGDRNLLSNLAKIDTPIKVRHPRKEDRQLLFQGLGKITTQKYRDFVWETLNRRVENVKAQRLSVIRWF